MSSVLSVVLNSKTGAEQDDQGICEHILTVMVEVWVNTLSLPCHSYYDKKRKFRLVVHLMIGDFYLKVGIGIFDISTVLREYRRYL